MKIIVNGAAGCMGQILCRKIEADPDLTLAAACDMQEGYPALSETTVPADIIIDFSHHASTRELTAYAARRKLPLVIATTGRTQEEEEMVRICAQITAVFSSANMSVGVAVLCQLAKSVLRTFPGAEIEIVETHHDRKVDVPSGTALLCANTLKQQRPESSVLVGRHENGRRDPMDISVHSLRYGNETGTHTIIFSCGNETLELTHRAGDRQLFADGALAAAKFLNGKPAGLYAMRDMLEVSHE